MGLRDEILEQPAAARRHLAGGGEALASIAAEVQARDVDSIVIAARGTSDHAAIYAQYVFGTRNRISVALAAPSIVSLYGVEPRFGRALVIGISQSGASPDVVGVVAAARRQGAPTIAITNEPGSPLAAAAEHVIELRAGPELAVAATKTYTTSLLAIARLSAAMGGAPGASGALARSEAARGEAEAQIAAIPDAIEAALTAEPAVASIARELGGIDRAVVLGRGYEYATAREWALKLKELARVFADPYSAADFRHGPLALVGPGVPVLAVLPEGPPAPDLMQLLGVLRKDLRADVLVLSDSPSSRAAGTRSIALPPGVPDWLRPIVSIVPAQLLAYHLTRATGLDPEAPRNLQKVTRTR
ncbi:MAG: SIS domain-containing protein [Chloroflexi bacterium]|nr:SIS domain-containing protein [Chloroflexota bacterium]